MWVTSYGRDAIAHLLKTNSKIYLEITDSVGAYYDGKNVHFMYAITGSKESKGPRTLILEYDKKETWEEMRILICKGSYYLGKGERSFFNQGKVIIIDYNNSSEEIKGHIRDSLLALLGVKLAQRDSVQNKTKNHIDESNDRDNPKNQSYIYKSFREFYYLTGVHEIVHTTSKNIAVSRKLEDAETPAFKKELKARRKLGKVLRSKRIQYN